MLPQNTSGLVGLIVIKASGDSDDAPTADIASDATLGQLFHWLARGNRVERGEAEAPPGRLAQETGATARLGVRRLAMRLFGRKGTTLVTADCRSLGAQLDGAARQLRRKIAAARPNDR